MNKNLLMIMLAIFSLVGIKGFSQANSTGDEFTGLQLNNFTEEIISGNLSWIFLDLSGDNVGDGDTGLFGNTQNETGSETALVSETLDLSQGTEYTLTINFFMNETEEGNVNELYAEISPDNGTTWNTVASYTSPVGDGGTAMVREDIIFNQDLTNNAKIRLRTVNNNGLAIVLDDISFTQTTDDDARLISTIDPIQQAGLIDISGEIENRGNATLTSVELNWQIDNGTVNTATLNGLNVQPGNTFTYTHPESWDDAQPGTYELKVWISKANGSDIINDYATEITKNISIPTGSTDMMPLLERFTSSSCGPCAIFNDAFFNDFHAERKNEYLYISYQLNFPAPDDYYIEDAGTRRSYYSVNSIPALKAQGLDAEANVYQNNTADSNIGELLDGILDQESYFEFNTAIADLNGQVVTLNIEVTPYVSGNYTVRAAVIEERTTGNVGSNGEDHFTNVMMSMLGGAEGTAVNFTQDTNYSNTLTADLSDTFIEDYNDLQLIVFIQNDDTKEIMQAARATGTLGIDNHFTQEEMTIYPNPVTEGIVNINTKEEVSVQVYDVTGKLVLNNTGLSIGNNIINLNGLSQGVYMAKNKNKK